MPTSKDKQEDHQEIDDQPRRLKTKFTWDHEKDNCGIDPDENPCGDANEY